MTSRQELTQAQDSSNQVLFLPFTPFDPTRKLAFREAEFLVVDHSFSTPARPGRKGDMAHLVIKHAGDRNHGNIGPIVGARDGDQVAMTILGPQLLVGGKSTDPRRPSNHRLQPTLEMQEIHLLEQFLQVDGLATGIPFGYPISHMRTHPGEDLVFAFLSALAGTREGPQGSANPILELGMDWRRRLAKRIWSLADPMTVFLDQSPSPLPPAGILDWNIRGVLRARWSGNGIGNPMRRWWLRGFEKIHDELESGANHEGPVPESRPCGISIRSILRRTGPNVRLWMGQGPNRSSASR